MTARKNIALFASLLAIAATQATAQAQPATPAAQAAAKDATGDAGGDPGALAAAMDLDYEKFVLPNGLTTIIYADPSAKDVLVSMTYKVGSKDEPEGKSGFAHLFEHMMFQATGNREGEYFTPYQNNNITQINGSTTTDRTNYYEVVPPEALDLALWMESDRMQYLLGAIDLPALDSQRAVVKNEKRQRETPQSEAQGAAFRAALYPRSHPYSHSVIGSMDDLDQASVADARDWFENYYGASNAVLVIAGNVDIAAAKRKVSHYFQDVRPGEQIQRIGRWVPRLDDIRTLEFTQKGSTRTLSRVWPVPGGDSRDGVLLGAFANAIAGGSDSILNQALVEHGGPAFAVSAAYSDGQVNGLFSIDVTLKPTTDIDAINARIDTLLADLFAAGPDARRLRQNLAASDEAFVAALESAGAIGSLLGANEVATGDPQFHLQARAWEAAASPKQVGAVAREWLARPYVYTITRPEPETAPAVTGAVDRSHIPALDTQPPERAPFPAIATETLPSGVEIVVLDRPRLPLVNVSIVFDTGRFIARDYPDQLASLTFGSLFDASTRYPVDAIGAKMRALNLYPSAIAGDRRSAIEFSTVAPKLPEAFGFVAQVLRNPLFPQSKLDEYMETVDPNYDSYERDPRGWEAPLFSQALWGKDHPYGKIARRDAVKAITRADMVRFYRNELAPSNMKVFFVGDIDMAQARALVAGSFAGWHDDATPAPLLPTARAETGATKVVLIDVPGAQQSEIMGGRLLGEWTPRGAMLENITNSALGGGFSGRVNMNLREDKGWTYGTYTKVGDTPDSQRSFYVTGSVQTDRTADAIREIRKEIDAYSHDDPISAEEFATQKDTLLKALENGLSSNADYLNVLTDADLRGLPLDFMASTPGLVRGLTLADAVALSRAAYRTDDFVWTISGDLSRIEPAIRALDLGPIEIRDAYGEPVAATAPGASPAAPIVKE